MTSEALKAMLQTPAALFAMMLLASLSNGFKQLLVVKQTGKPMTFWDYLSYAPETFGVIVGNVIAFALLIYIDQLNVASALAVGYGTNSVIDLLPGRRSVALKATPDDPTKLTPEKKAAIDAVASKSTDGGEPPLNPKP
jgi:hypothetical protein